MNFLQELFLIKKQHKEPSKARKIIKIVFLSIGALIMVGCLSVFIFIITLLGEIPDVRTIENLKIAQSTVILDRNGNQLYAIHGEENRKYIVLSDISKNIQNATISIEDKGFYKHSGFDLFAMMRSMVHNVLNPNDKARSGSTITQQLVKNIFLSPEQTVRRKLKELILSYQVEKTYSKEKILELYLNQIPYGNNAYGIEMAAQIYFGKSARELSVIESAILASLPNGPSFYNPYGQRDRLMGYCKLNKNQTTATNEFTTDTGGKKGPFMLHIKATNKVYVKINMDEGANKEEVTMQKGGEKDVTATSSLGFLLGNKASVEMSYDGFPFKPLGGKSFVVTPQTVRDYLVAPEEFDKKLLATQEATIKNSCRGMDDENYVYGRKDLVLEAMLDAGYITKEEMKTAWEQGSKIQFKKYVENIKYPHFVMYVKDYLENKYGQEVVEKGGLVVKTTLDPALQDLAQNQISTNIDKLEKRYKMSNMSLVSANPKTGQILAMVGSRDYWDEKHDGNVNIAISRRQPGSSFKPFTFANMFQQGYGAGTVLWDVRTQFGNGTPPNNADGGFDGPLPVRKALAWSRNITAIKAFFVGGEEDTFLDYLAPLGFPYMKTDREKYRQTNPTYSYGWPMAIGSVEVRLIDMVQGYAIFANGGVKKDLTPILEVRDNNGNIIEQYNDASGNDQVMDPQVAYMINSILSDKEARPVGYWRDRITVPGQVVAVKTGTSNKRISKSLILPSDNWTMGYSTTLVTGLWGGNNDGSAMTGDAFDVNTIGVIWKNYMTEALKGKTPDPFPRPEGITEVAVNRLSGKLATQGTPDGFVIKDIFPSFGVPKEYDTSFAKVKVDSRNNLIATEDCAPAVVKDKIVIDAHEVIDRPGWDEAIRRWIASHTDTFPEALASIPKEESPLCKPIPEEQKPTVSIISPLSFGEIVSGNVNVFVQTSAYAGVDKVEYYLDGTLVSTSTEKPYTGVVVIPKDANIGSTHGIKAIVYDKNAYTAEGSIEVKIVDKDTSAPHISFLAPSEGATIALNSILVLDAQAYDDNSSIASVEFSFDGQSVGMVKKSPYRINVAVSEGKYAQGNHTVTAKAVDVYGNVATASVTIICIAPEVTESILAITKPTTGAVVGVGQSVPIQFVVKGKELKEVTLMGKRGDVYLTVQTVSDISSGSETFTSSWIPDVAGTYDLYLKVVDKAGEMTFSQRISVTAQ